MAKEKLIKATFLKCPEGYAYTAPYTYEIPESLFKKFQRDGVCCKSDEVLPLDIPYRKELYNAGIHSLDNLMDEEDIAEIKGFTEQMAYRVDKWLAKYNESEKMKAAKIAAAESDKDSKK